MLRALLSLVLLLSPATLAAQKRLITHEDVFLMHRVGAPVLSPDGRVAVVSVSEPSYDAGQETSDLWLIPTDGKTPPRRLTHTRGAESSPVFSPDGRTLAFTARRDGDEAPQVYLLPMDGGEARRLTNRPTGASSPVFRPDGKAILYQSMTYPGARTDEDNRKAAAARRARKDTAKIFDTFPVRYWNSWLDDREPVLFVQNLEGPDEPTLLAPGGGLQGNFNPTGSGQSLSPVWAPDGSFIVFVATADRHTTMHAEVEMHLYRISATGGAPQRLTPAGASYTKPQFSPGGQTLYAFESRTSTPSQIYFNSRLAAFAAPAFSQPRILTAAWDRSAGALTIDPNGRTLYLEAEDDGHDRIFRLPATGGPVETLYTPETGALTDLNIAGGVFIAKYSASTDPGQVVRFDPAQKSFIRLTSFNADRLAQLDLPPMQHFWFNARNGKRIHNVIVPPPAHDPAKKYPIVVFPHGGPNSMSKDAFSTRWNFHLLTSPGYFLLMTNYTGSTGFGEKFTDDIERDVLRGPAQEALQAIEEAAKRYPSIDLSRQAAIGASYGGYFMNWFNGHTDQFKCLVNHAGAVNNESQYGVNDGGLSRELRMGAPVWEFGQGQWNDQSPIRYSSKWKTPTLVTQGELDYRVPFGESMTTYKLLQRRQIPARFVLFPDEGHWILKGENSRVHMREVLDWLAKYLK
ncbi:MAG: S9 family peptidase [Bryobacteraceae bacterium]|nr:S9 family peptidase [Bryobacteraceae bacterium]